METLDVIDVLNDLLAEETRSLLPRLHESIVFVSWPSADEQSAVARMIAEQREHPAWLVAAMNDLGGNPVPALPDIRSTNFHFVELSSVLPRILAEERRLLRAYESAGATIGDNVRAAQVIARVAERRRRHIDALARLTARTSPQTA
ncbi:MAG: hypothetical protein HOP29_05480 [Phycisphaerales bacterium]|nr:hypothetical protein [Phycisphaerales bacterium]